MRWKAFGNNQRSTAICCRCSGVTQFAVVVNKMDFVGYRQDVFDGIEKEYREFWASSERFREQMIPVSAKQGDNIALRSGNMSWYRGPGTGDAGLLQEGTGSLGTTTSTSHWQIYKFDARRILAGRITPVV